MNSSIMHTLKLSLIYSSLILNIYFVYMYSDSGLFHEKWSKSAVEEAEAVAAVSCSGHGRVYLDGALADDGQPVCECNACFRGRHCSESVPECVLDADSGNPIFLEPFWMRHAASTALVVSGWHRMGYEFDDGSLISRQLRSQIIKLHKSVKNVNTTDRYIIFGAGSIQILNAAVHSLSLGSSMPAKVVASIPYYPVYKSQTELLDSAMYKFMGDTSMYNPQDLSTNFIEFVTSPNNPDGQLKNAVIQGSNKIYDLAYYWPHYSPITAPVDQNIAIFTLSKLTGHAGSRFGWALIKDKALYERMVTYMDLNTYGVSRETQLRALKLLNNVVEGGRGEKLFEFGFETMKHRWEMLSDTLEASKRFSIQNLSTQYCTYLEQHRTPSPAFAWIKCEKEEDEDCLKVLREADVIGRAGSLFGAKKRYVRVSLSDSQDHFNILMQRIDKLVSEESKYISTVDSTANKTWDQKKFPVIAEYVLPMDC